MSQPKVPDVASPQEKADIIRMFEGGPTQAEPSRDWFSGMQLKLGSSGRSGLRLGEGSITPEMTPEQLQEEFRASERGYRTRIERSVEGESVTARSGDSISRILGTSDPQAIGNFMRANGMTSSSVEVGRNYFRPDEVTAYGNSVALGQAVLNNDNARLAALAQERLGDEIAPLSDLRGTVRNIFGSVEAKGVAADFQRRAEVLMQSADQAQAGGNPSMALAYRRAASNYVVAGGEAGRAGASFIDGASIPRTFVNPPEFKVPDGWSYMGQNNVGKVVMPYDYVSLNAGILWGGGGVSMNLHNFEVFGQWQAARNYPHYTFKPGVSLLGGNIMNGYGAQDTSDFLAGASAQASVFVPIPFAPAIGWGGGLNHSYGGKTAVETGLSFPPGVSISPVGYGWSTEKKGK